MCPAIIVVVCAKPNYSICKYLTAKSQQLAVNEYCHMTLDEVSLLHDQELSHILMQNIFFGGVSERCTMLVSCTTQPRLQLAAYTPLRVTAPCTAGAPCAVSSPPASCCCLKREAASEASLFMPRMLRDSLACTHSHCSLDRKRLAYHATIAWYIIQLWHVITDQVMRTVAKQHWSQQEIWHLFPSHIDASGYHPK